MPPRAQAPAPQSNSGDNGRSDGFVRLLGGVNRGLRPLGIENPEQYAGGLNGSVRGGFFHTRPGFTQYEAVDLPSGRFQGAGVYRLDSQDRIVLSVAGQVHWVNLDTGTLDTHPSSATFPTTSFGQATFKQADKFMVVQNGLVEPVENWPIILDGSEVVDNLDVMVFDPSVGTEGAFVRLRDFTDFNNSMRVPIGTVMSFGQGRLFIVVSRVWETGKLNPDAGWINDLGKRFIIACDIIQPDNAQELLAATENIYFNEGGAMSLPGEMGFIYGSDFFRNAATGSGLGNLVMLARDGASAFAVNTPRSGWKDNDIGQVMFFNAGTRSPWSVITVNDDLVYRGVDSGVRSIRYTAQNTAGASGSLSNVPLSYEVEDRFDLDDETSLQYVSGAFVGNRLFMTVNGHALSSGEIAFRGLVSLDTAVTASVTATTGGSQPRMAWDDVWTGFEFLQVLKARYNGVDRLFVVVKRNDANELWYLDEDATSDGGQAITSWVKTRAYVHGDIRETKAFQEIEMVLTDLVGDVTVQAYWKPDGYPLWCATTPETLRAASSGFRHIRVPVKLRPPKTVQYVDPTTSLPLLRGTYFEYCIKLTGHALIERMVAYTAPQPDRPWSACQTLPATAVVLAESATAGAELDEFAAHEVA